MQRLGYLCGCALTGRVLTRSYSCLATERLSDLREAIDEVGVEHIGGGLSVGGSPVFPGLTVHRLRRNLTTRPSGITLGCQAAERRG